MNHTAKLYALRSEISNYFVEKRNVRHVNGAIHQRLTRIKNKMRYRFSTVITSQYAACFWRYNRKD